MKNFTIAVVGDSQSGKSTLIRRLCDIQDDRPLVKTHYSFDLEGMTFTCFLRKFPLANLSRTLQLMMSVDLIIYAFNPIVEENAYLMKTLHPEEEQDRLEMISNHSKKPKEKLKVAQVWYDTFWTPFFQAVDYLDMGSKVIVSYGKLDHELIEYNEDLLFKIRDTFDCEYTKGESSKSKFASVFVSALKNENVFSSNSKYFGSDWLAKVLIEKAEELRGGLLEDPLWSFFSGKLCVFQTHKIMGTGTVARAVVKRGAFAVGDKVEILPQMVKSEIASIEEKGKSIASAETGQIIGVWLRGISLRDVSKGSVIVRVGEGSVNCKSSNAIETEIMIVRSPNGLGSGFKLLLVSQFAATPVEIYSLTGVIGFHVKGAKKKKQENKAQQGTLCLAKMRLLKGAYLERFEEFPELGRFFLVESNQLVGTGRVLKHTFIKPPEEESSEAVVPSVTVKASDTPREKQKENHPLQSESSKPKSAPQAPKSEAN